MTKISDTACSSRFANTRGRNSPRRLRLPRRCGATRWYSRPSLATYMTNGIAVPLPIGSRDLGRSFPTSAPRFAGLSTKRTIASRARDSLPIRPCIFLRLGLLDEGIEYCKECLRACRFAVEVEARVRYGLSMLYSNIGTNKSVLDEAQVAVRSTGRRAIRAGWPAHSRRLRRATLTSPATTKRRQRRRSVEACSRKRRS